MTHGPAIGPPRAVPSFCRDSAIETQDKTGEIAAFSLAWLLDPHHERDAVVSLARAPKGPDMGLLDQPDFEDGERRGHAEPELGSEPESRRQQPGDKKPAAAPHPPKPAPEAAVPENPRPLPKPRFAPVPISGPNAVVNPLPFSPRVRPRSALQAPRPAPAKTPTPARAFEWREEVRQQLQQLRRTPDGARIEIELPEIGTLRIHLYQRPGGRRLRIYVASKAQAAMLRTHRSRLVAFLGLKGEGRLDVEIFSDDGASRIGLASPVDQPPVRHGT